MIRLLLILVLAVFLIGQIDWLAIVGSWWPFDWLLPAPATAVAQESPPLPASAPWWLAWAAGVLVLPALLFPLLRVAVRQGSNLVNSYVLLVLSAAELAVAPFLVPIGISGVGQLVLWLLLAALVGAYNLLSLHVALRFES